MYYVMRASAPSLHRESTDSLIYIIYVPSIHRESYGLMSCISMHPHYYT